MSLMEALISHPKRRTPASVFASCSSTPQNVASVCPKIHTTSVGNAFHISSEHSAKTFVFRRQASGRLERKPGTLVCFQRLVPVQGLETCSYRHENTVRFA